MKLKKLFIKNFRNFEDIEVEMTNKNVIFGMNDVGKTNFLHSLRFLLDRKFRNLGFQESDYFQKNVKNPIEICLEIDITDFEDIDTQNIISKVGKYRDRNNLESIFIKLIGEFDNDELLGNPILYWGNDLENLDRMAQSGNFLEIDKLFKVIYIDPLIDMDKLFNANRRKIFKVSESEKEDNFDNIQKLSKELNEEISDMSVVKNFQAKLTDGYHELKDENISIVLKSEMAIKGVFSDIRPYIQKEEDNNTENLYPTSGDGRKKILAYALLNYLNYGDEADNRIPIFLIEEPENSLHRAMRISLSKQLFNSKDIYKYFIVSTHSSSILYEMDRTNLIRIFNDNKTNCKSTLYIVSDEFSKQKKELNYGLTQALFADKVLLIEGPSEKVLFEKILEELNPMYEMDGGFILEVDGIKFKPYRDTLIKLGIKVAVKTDNDLKETAKGKSKEFEKSGYKRCMNLLGNDTTNIGNINIEYKGTKDRKEKIKEEKVDFYEEIMRGVGSVFIDNRIYLSKIDLENDLYEAIPEEMDKFRSNSVNYLQNKKLLHMLELCAKLNEESCEKIARHDNFKCLNLLLENNK